MMKAKSRVLGVLFASYFALALASCSDGEAYLQGPLQGEPLAVGAYQTLSYGDSCSGGGKLNFCGTDRLVSLDELSSGNPNVASIVLGADAPITTSTATHFVLGVAPGKATLHFRGTFDDGSVRSTDLEIEVSKADRSALRTSCNGVELGEVVTIPGGAASFQVELFAGATKLAGFHPDAIAPTAGVTPAAGWDSQNWFAWAAPAEPGMVEVRSGFLSSRVGVLRAYGPSEVSDIVVKSVNGSSLVGQPGDKGRIEANTKVRGVQPCDSSRVVFRTETPAVCSGPNGAEIWPAEDDYGGFANFNTEGVCRISASADGVRFFKATSIQYFVIAPRGEERFDGFNEPCAVEGSTSCTYGENSQVTLCREGRWVSKETCGPTRTCDARDPALAGCVAGGPCAECRGLR
ncbi:MAG: hypothetical protein SFV15_05490 [Polyangiaceae bacterium]|nr:hypothetical protein [Polyangiaceae bacterium]